MVYIEIMTKFSQKSNYILGAIIVVLGLFVAFKASAQTVSTTLKPPIFYVSFDRSGAADYAVGSRDVQYNGHPVLVANDAVLGNSILIPDYSGITYLGAGNFNINEGTVSFWIKPKWDINSLDEYKHTIFSLNNNYQKTEDKYFYLGRLNGKELKDVPFSFALEDKNDRDYRYKVNASALVIGQWNHIVLTWKYGKNSLMRIFINGQLAFSDSSVKPKPGDAPNLGSIFTFGSPNIYEADFQLDELMVFNVAADQTAAQQLYAYGVKLFNYSNGSFNIVFNNTVPQGQVLGTSTIDVIGQNNNGSNNKYTKATALYKVAGKPDVYAILNGQKHYISSPAVFNRYGYKWSDVKTVSQQELDKFPAARWLRSSDASTVYYIFQRPQGQWLKIAIPTPTVFISYPQNYWGNVVVVDQDDINAYPNATLVKTSDAPGIYLIENGYRRLFVSANSFEQRGYNWADVVVISQAHLDSFLPGATLD